MNYIDDPPFKFKDAGQVYCSDTPCMLIILGTTGTRRQVEALNELPEPTQNQVERFRHLLRYFWMVFE